MILEGRRFIIKVFDEAKIITTSRLLSDIAWSYGVLVLKQTPCYFILKDLPFFLFT